MGVMKKIALFVLTAIMMVGIIVPIKAEAASGEVELNDTYFPDANFLRYLTYNTDNIVFDSNYDNKLQQAELDKITELDISGLGIKNLKGIEHFRNLQKLDCGGNLMTSLDLRKNTKLTYLVCDNCELTSLDLSKNTQIGSLVCSDNKLTSLTISNNSVIYSIACKGNKLTSLDISKCTALEILECYDNQLTSLNITNNTKLEILACQNNKISSLNITSNKLTTVKCQNNALWKLYLPSTKFLTTATMENQSVSAALIEDGNKQFIDMSAYDFGATDIEVVTSGVTYDAQAKCLVFQNKAAVGNKVKYNYKSKKGVMDVTITISSIKKGKYPSTIEETTTPAPTQPPSTAEPTQPTQPTQPSTTVAPTTSPKETTSSVKPTQKPIQKPTQKPSEQPGTDESSGVVTEPVTEPSGEDNSDETTEYVPMESVTFDEGGPMGKIKGFLPILIGAVIALVVVVIVLIILISRSNKKGKKNDKYRYNNRIRY